MLSSKSVDTTWNIPFPATSWIDVQKKLESFAWIQCDEPLCMKWRMVPKVELKKWQTLDKWFCKMNADQNFASCHIPEEDVNLYDRLAEKSGLRYIKSEIAVGTLLWAKMNGFCRWPAVVTPEPLTDAGHASKSSLGEITHYHMEFLGLPHSHGWVSSKHISFFTEQSIDCQLSSRSDLDSLALKTERKKHRRRHFSLTTRYRSRSSYKNGVSVLAGVQEAVTLLHLSNAERLTRCIYVGPLTSNCTEHVLAHKTHLQKYPSTQTTRRVFKCFRKGKCYGEKSSAKKSSTLIFHKSRDACEGGTNGVTVAFSKFTGFLSSPKCTTNKGSFFCDLENYRLRQCAFDQAMSQFAALNGLELCSCPVWQNKHVTLFDLFLAVCSKGGFHQVTQNRAWLSVYREVTEIPSTVDRKQSNLAKSFYQRSLLPFEQDANAERLLEESLHALTTVQQRQHCSPPANIAPSQVNSSYCPYIENVGNTDTHSVRSSNSIQDLLQQIPSNECYEEMDRLFGRGCDDEKYPKYDDVSFPSTQIDITGVNREIDSSDKSQLKNIVSRHTPSRDSGNGGSAGHGNGSRCGHLCCNTISRCDAGCVSVHSKGIPVDGEGCERLVGSRSDDVGSCSMFSDAALKRCECMQAELEYLYCEL